MHVTTNVERRCDRLEKDLASLEEHVQHIAATLVKVVELVQQVPAVAREIQG